MGNNDHDSGNEREWISKGGESSDFKEYENKVERFLASLNEAIAKLHGAGHLDEEAYLRLDKLARDFQGS